MIYDDPFAELGRPLNAREKEVLALQMLGYSFDEIGWRLHLTHKTVKNYSYLIRRKLGCTAAQYAGALVCTRRCRRRRWIGAAVTFRVLG